MALLARPSDDHLTPMSRPSKVAFHTPLHPWCRWLGADARDCVGGCEDGDGVVCAEGEEITVVGDDEVGLSGGGGSMIDASQVPPPQGSATVRTIQSTAPPTTPARPDAANHRRCSCAVRTRPTTARSSRRVKVLCCRVIAASTRSGSAMIRSPFRRAISWCSAARSDSSPRSPAPHRTDGRSSDRGPTPPAAHSPATPSAPAIPAAAPCGSTHGPSCRTRPVRPRASTTSHAHAASARPVARLITFAIGFPSTGRRAKAIGECWDSTASADGTFEILIRPDLTEADGALAQPIVAALAAQLVHAAVGIQGGKGPLYRRVALGIGLTGTMRATEPGPTFVALVAPILEAVGPLPPCPAGGGQEGRRGRPGGRGRPQSPPHPQAGQPARQMRLPYLRLCRPHRPQMAR